MRKWKHLRSVGCNWVDGVPSQQDRREGQADRGVETTKPPSTQYLVATEEQRARGVVVPWLPQCYDYGFESYIVGWNVLWCIIYNM